MKLKNLNKILAGILLIVCILIGFTVYSQNQRQELEVDYLNVGQGDSILIKTPYEQNILIDGGPDNSVLSGLGNNLAYYDKDIDLVILSHPDADHVTGLVEVLRRYHVKKVMLTGVSHKASYYLAFLDEIKKQNIPTEIVKGPEDITLGKDLDMRILYPLTCLEGQKVENTNDTSIVADLRYKNDSFLFTGDAEQKVEDELISDKVDLSADVLKVSHHGSKTATSQEFLDAVKPQIAVISVGKDNKYGHPTPTVLDRLAQNGIKILRTDKGGTIVIDSDGEHIQIKNQD